MPNWVEIGMVLIFTTGLCKFGFGFLNSMIDHNGKEMYRRWWQEEVEKTRELEQEVARLKKFRRSIEEPYKESLRISDVVLDQMKEIYVSCDVETDGPIPGPNSMLSLGAAAFNYPNEKPIGVFSANLELLAGATPNPATMEWWATKQAAWEACRKDLQPVDVAMKNFVDWVKALPGKPVFVGYPTGFDFTYCYWYIIKHGLESPFSFSALDLKSYAMAVLKKPYRESTKKHMPKHWFPKDMPHTHVALDDAIEQGIMMLRMMKQNGVVD
jgi:hypothetical protein